MLTEYQRVSFEQAMLRALRAKYPGRPVRIEWDEPHAVLNPESTPAPNDDRVEDAA